MNFKDNKVSNCIVIGVINQKGGVGKTTTTINLAASLGEQKKKVLLIDLDPQGNSSSGLGVEKRNCEYSSYDCLLNDEVNTEEAIVNTDTEKVWVIPATLDLAGAETELGQVIARETRLADAIDEVKEYFDYVLIDCPPSLGQLTVNALTASDQVIIPIQCEFFALEGLTKIIETINIIKKRLNPNLEVLGVLFTMFDNRTTLTKQVIDQVTEYFGDKVFDTKIPRTVRLAEAPGFGQSIIEYEPNGKGAKAYRNFAKEVLERCKQLSD